MEIRVGQTLKFKGQDWICTKIELREIEEFAGTDSRDYAELYVNEINAQDLDRQVDDFCKDDIVKMTRWEVTLEQPGYSRFTIRTRFHVKKVASINPNEITEEELSDGILPDSTNQLAE